MEKITFTKSLTIGRTLTKNQSLANEIYTHFQKKIPYKQIIGLIKYKGAEGVYWAFNETRQAQKVENPAALFIWKLKVQKVSWQKE